MHQAKFPGEEVLRGFEFGLNREKRSCSRLRLQSAKIWCAERKFDQAQKERKSDGVQQAATAG